MAVAPQPVENSRGDVGIPQEFSLLPQAVVKMVDFGYKPPSAIPEDAA